MNTTSQPNCCSPLSAVMVCSMSDAYFCFFQTVLISAVKDRTVLGPLGDFHFVPSCRVRCHFSKLSRNGRSSGCGSVGFCRCSDTLSLHTSAATNSKIVNRDPTNSR